MSLKCFGQNFRATLKLIIFSLSVISFVLTTMPLYFLLEKKKKKIRPILAKIVSSYSRWAIFFLGIKLTGDKSEIQKGSLVVSNHLSYLDILLLASYCPASFVTSIEMKHMPFLGQLTQLAACVFVERRSRENLNEEIKEITQALENNETIIIFPEATSTNGDDVIRFRSPLFNSAIDADTMISPICLNYLRLNSENINEQNRDYVYWYGDMTFLAHFWSFLKQKKLTCKLTQFAPLIAKDENPKDLANYTHKIIQRQFHAQKILQYVQGQEPYKQKEKLINTA